ncbi:MAG: hypothetical protein M1528_00825 [Candidatus Marsarchaeota archaeon]|nr:hypothetical protein [Candidatus Marsarchaeota archaeon]
MHYAIIDKKHAEALRSQLAKRNFLRKNAGVLHSDSYVLFPVNNATATIKKLLKKQGSRLVERMAEERRAEALPEANARVARGYDMLGNIAIIEGYRASKREIKKFADSLLKAHKSIRTVIIKAGPVSGRYRTRRFSYVAGERNYIAGMWENGCRFVFDVRKAFFSSRLSFERSRISALSKKKEKVIVMFAGVGPFVVEIAKCNPKAEVLGIELNSYAAAAMAKNIKLNKTGNAMAICADVKEAANRYRGFADRIVMPLPKDSGKFLDEAFTMAKKRAALHVYIFGIRKTAKRDALEYIKKRAKARRIAIRLKNWRMVREYSHREIEIVLDLILAKGR